jgi:hypothetical protein
MNAHFTDICIHTYIHTDGEGLRYGRKNRSKISDHVTCVNSETDRQTVEFCANGQMISFPFARRVYVLYAYIYAYVCI